MSCLRLLIMLAMWVTHPLNMQIHGEVKDQPSGNLKKIDCVVLKVEPKMATATFCYARIDHAPKKKKKFHLHRACKKNTVDSNKCPRIQTCLILSAINDTLIGFPYMHLLPFCFLRKSIFFKTICLISQANGVPVLDFDIDIPPWNEMDTCSISTGTWCHTAAQNKDYINKSKRDITQG